MLALAFFTMAGCRSTNKTETHGYASVNGLTMYYEIHGTGRPLVLLHGAYSSINGSFGKLIPELAKHRQVIAVDLQGHGRTADINRPITYERMADDVAAALKQLKIDTADVFGYSMGGGVALQMAIRHPEQVRKLIVASATFNSGGLHPELVPMIKTIQPEVFDGSPMKKEYDSLAPNPQDWPMLVRKLVALDTTVQDWPAASIQAIRSPTFLIFGDADAVRLEHAVEMFKLRGGGVMGDLAGLPGSQLAILPHCSHVGVILEHTDQLLAMIPSFLDAPMPAANKKPS